ncbi:hypothetical protein HDU76_008235 [Blyttiomyces sp. JEL0837]|nr:hypothetical protein HDU76_008235 [Blyttiomyces sp. JEL0837]
MSGESLTAKKSRSKRSGKAAGQSESIAPISSSIIIPATTTAPTTGSATAITPTAVVGKVVAPIESAEGSDGGFVSKTFTGASTEVVNKRLRTLKKRLTKLENYETVPKAELNKDQVEALQKKSEVVALVKELEEIIKQLQSSEADEVKITKSQKEEAKLDEERRLTAALLEADGGQTENGRTEYVNSTTSFLQDYFTGSKREFVPGTSYADLRNLIELLAHPPQRPKFGASAFDTDMHFNGIQNGTTEHHEQEEQGGFFAPSFGKSINFFQPSEILAWCLCAMMFYD